jgi:hypothetical protein
MSVIKQFSDLLLDSSIVIASYNGFGKIKFFTEFANVTMMIKASIEAGDEAWTGEATKGILQEIEQGIELGSSLCYDPINKLVTGVKHELFHTSDQYEIPSFDIGDSIAYIQFSTSEWKAINKFGAIAKDKVHIQVTGNLLSLTAIDRQGMIAIQTIILDNALPDLESVTFTVPSRALFDAESASVEIGKEKILLQGKDQSSRWAIDPNEPPFFPGLIPEGAIEVSVSRKELKPLFEKGGKLKININKKGAVQIKSTNGTQLMIQIGSPVDVPDRTSFQVMAEAIESAIRLIRTAKLITLALPVGLQYIAVSAAAVRCLIPTVVSAVKALTAKEIISPEPLVLESESITVELDSDSEVTMTVSAVEQLNLPSGMGLDPKSLQEAIDRLKVETESAKDAISRIPIGSGVEVEVAVQAIEETLLSEAQAALSTERGSMFSKEDIKKITNAIVKAIARIEAIRLDLQTWELQVTFRN